LHLKFNQESQQGFHIVLEKVCFPVI